MLLSSNEWTVFVRQNCKTNNAGQSTFNSKKNDHILADKERLQRLLACRRSRKSSATVVEPSSVTLRDYNRMSRRLRPSAATSTCVLVDHPVTSGSAARVDQERDGSTRSGETTVFPQRTCGGVRGIMGTEQQRYGPRWLCDNDDETRATAGMGNRQQVSVDPPWKRQKMDKYAILCPKTL